MAMSLIFTCEQCGFSVEGWDEGNPYIINSKGKRVFFYHPGGEDVMEKVVEEILGPIYTDEARAKCWRHGRETHPITFA